MNGTVKWFNAEKGYGFIISDDNEELYFNVRGIIGAVLPRNGDKVSFETSPGYKGPKAVKVAITEQASVPKQQRDDRIACPGCQRKIVPRLITYQGEPEKSVCPFCATVVKRFSFCFIATAVYGDPSCSEVRTLRRFRDNTLKTHPAGRRLVWAYYRYSPAMARSLEHMPGLSRLVRWGLNRLVSTLNHRG